jgi:cobalamin biosynthesis Mg chelatase CobN
MTDENTVFDAAYEFNMNGMSPEAAAEAGAHSDSQDARIKELESKLDMVAAYLKNMTERGDDEAKALLDGLDLDYEHDDDDE